MPGSRPRSTPRTLPARTAAWLAIGCLGVGVCGGGLAATSLSSAWAGPPEQPAAPEVIDVTVEPKPVPPSYSRYKKLETYARALALIEQHYVRPVDDTDLVYASLVGMTEALDPHSSFLPPRDAKMLVEDIDGRFGGVGLVVTWELEDDEDEEDAGEGETAPKAGGDDGHTGPFLRIQDVIPGGPAAAAGLSVNDKIVAIEGKPIAQYLDIRDAVAQMRGPTGTQAHFSVIAAGQTEVEDLSLARAMIDPPAVEVRYLGDGVGTLRLRDFAEDGANEVRSGLAELRKQSEGELRGVILDLRDNGGGLLNEAVGIVDIFVGSGPIVRTRGRRGVVLDEAKAHALGTEAKLPLVVLMNKGSASASEIVAGALQDHGRALIVGERSYGKGSVQAPYRLGDGSILKLTTALYYTPNDRLIQASGIAPDVYADMAEPSPQDSRPQIDPERSDPKHLKPEDFGRKSEVDTVHPAIVACEADYQLAGAVEQVLAWGKVAPKRGLRKRKAGSSQ